MNQKLKNTGQALDKLKKELSYLVTDCERHIKGIELLKSFMKELKDEGFEYHMWEDRTTKNCWYDIRLRIQIPKIYVGDNETHYWVSGMMEELIKTMVPDKDEVLKSMKRKIKSMEKVVEQDIEQEKELLNTNLQSAISRAILEDS